MKSYMARPLEVERKWYVVDAEGKHLGRLATEILRKAVYGMMPKSRLARKQFKKLKIYAGPEHPHAAQDPQTLEVK